MLKNAHLLRFPHPSSLRRTGKYASLLGISDALDLDFFQQPAKEWPAKGLKASGVLEPVIQGHDV
jgi:hypothetical protein